MRSYTNLIQGRRSVRLFTAQEINDTALKTILDAGICAPSACNKQPWLFYVVRTERMKTLVGKTCSQPWFAYAPLYIVIVGNNRIAWSRPSGNSVDIDTSIATTQMMLAAEDLGLASTWVCAFDQDAIHQILSLNLDEVAVSILAIGYPDKDYQQTAPYRRKSSEEVVRYV